MNDQPEHVVKSAPFGIKVPFKISDDAEFAFMNMTSDERKRHLGL